MQMPLPLFLLFAALLVEACGLPAFHTPQAIAQLPASQEAAAERPLIPRSVLFGYPERSAPSLSPDGLRIASQRPVNGTIEIWVRTLGATPGTTDDHPVTTAADDQKGNVTQFFWLADSQRIVYMRDPLGNTPAAIFIKDLKTAHSKNLTPDGTFVTLLGYDIKQPDQLLITRNNQGRDDAYRLNLTTGEATLDTSAPADLAWQGWIDDGNLAIRGYEANLPDGGHAIRVRDNANSPWREVMQAGPNDFAMAMFQPKSTNRLLIMTSIGSNTTHLETIDMRTGRRRMLFRGDPEVDMSAFWENRKTGKLDLIQFNADRYRFVFRDKAVAADMHRLENLHLGEIGNIDRNADDTKWIVTFQTNAVTWWYLYDRATKRATPIYENQPAFEHYKIATKQPIHFHARDGMLLHGYITMPVDAGSQAVKPPLIVLVHGGPEHRDNWGYDTWPMWLADRGYAVLQINFRGSQGYGMHYLAAGYHQWSGAMRTDLLDGKDWAIQHGYADPHRSCIMGGSYGGYATLAALAFSPDEFQCGVAMAAPADLVGLMNDHPGDNDFTRELGSNLDELTAASPINFVDRFKAPLLLLQGGSDQNIHSYQAENMAAALRKQGKSVEYYVFTQEGHGIGDQADAEALDAAIEDFLGRHLGGRIQPPTPAEVETLKQARR